MNQRPDSEAREQTEAFIEKYARKASAAKPRKSKARPS
jgi:hypothetical protein